jgi:uncharacterized integral membrane protein
LAAIRVSSELLEVVEETNMVKLIVGGVLSVLVLIFIVQNTQSVDVTFLAWTITVSRALLLIIILLFGITVGWIVGGIRQPSPCPALCCSSLSSFLESLLAGSWVVFGSDEAGRRRERRNPRPRQLETDHLQA